MPEIVLPHDWVARMKVCIDCGDEKPLSEFYNRGKDRPNEYRNDCKACVRARSLRRYNADRDRIKAETCERDKRNRAQRSAKRREWRRTESGKASTLAAIEQQKRDHPEKVAARVALGNAVKDGRLAKPNLCSCCGATADIHGHHEDYSKPFDVEWLCRSCHNQRHAA